MERHELPKTKASLSSGDYYVARMIDFGTSVLRVGVPCPTCCFLACKAAKEHNCIFGYSLGLPLSPQVFLAVSPVANQVLSGRANFAAPGERYSRFLRLS